MPDCPACKTRYSGGARLCRNCGGPLPAPEQEGADVAGALPPRGHVRACRGCGRVVPRQKARCEACRSEADVLVAPPRADDAYWARVTCTFRCGECGAWGPLGAVDAEGRAACRFCDRTTSLPIMFWRVLVPHAHAVADLAGPYPDGRVAQPDLVPRNPFARVGVAVAEAAGARYRDDDDLPRDLLAGPGVLPCPSCASLTGWATGAVVACSCGWSARLTRARKTLPARLGAVDRGVVALVAEEAQPRPAAPVAQTCPTCSAPLEVAEGVTRARCKYCDAQVVIPGEARARGAPRDPALWLLFTGPSAERGRA